MDLLVRSGADARASVHSAKEVYTEMLYQICRDYPGLPDPRTLSVDEIVWFYEGLRPELRLHTKPKKG